jgi:transcription elongation GreA/GreB family factor
MQSFKEKVSRFYIESVSDKIKTLQKQQEDLLESLKHETKSTAGDKYETSRAMLHQEQENIAAQLSVLLRQKAILESISLNKDVQAEKVQFGSLIKTNKGIIFIAAALGKALIEDQAVFAISPESPLGKLLIDQQTGKTITIQSANYIIEAIL